MSPSDQQLLIATRKGHEPSAKLLWARFAPRMLAYARTLLGNQEVAQDVVQSVFLKLLSMPRAEIRQVREVAAWLLRLTRNAAYNEIRAHARRRGREAAAPTRTPSLSLSIDLDLDAALNRLSRRDREVLILKHTAALTFDQLALALNINRNTAASRYRVAMEHLRRVLQEQGAAVDVCEGACRE